MPHKVTYSEFRDRRIAEASIEVDMGDGLVITIPPEECWPHTMPRSLDKSMRAIIGDEQVDAYLAAGGSLRMLDAIVADVQGAPKGK